MSDLDMEELSPTARALIDEVRGVDGPVPADRVRIKRALVATIASGASLAASTAASGTAAAGTATAAAGGSLGLGVKIAAIALVVAAVGGTALVVTPPDEPVAPAQVERSVTEPRPNPATPRTVSAQPAPTELAVEEPAPLPQPEPEVVVAEAPQLAPPRTRREPAPAIVEPASTITDELVLLRDAQRAMRADDPGAALRLLDEHARRYPTGNLAEEREAARVVALCQAGRADDAHAVAARFLRERPNSPLRARVSAACPQ